MAPAPPNGVEEAGTAGRNAAEYVKLGSERSSEGKEIRINPVEGVRYTVPGTIHTDRMDENLTCASVWAVFTQIATSVHILMTKE